MESSRHHRLKLIAMAFLHANGWAAVACEVRCPVSRFRTDVAGYADPLTRRSRHSPIETPAPALGRVVGRPTTVIVECKQSRPDFLRDRRELSGLLSERSRIDAHRRHLEERLVKAVEPHLRASETMLFPELEAWHFAHSRVPGYRAVLRELRRIDRQIHGDTKFWAIAHYALADHLLIAAPAGMIRPEEVPPGWGMLEVAQEALDDDPARPPETPLTLRLRGPAAGPSPSRDAHRVRLLRNIAVAASGPRRSTFTIGRVIVTQSAPPTRDVAELSGTPDASTLHR